MATVKTTESGNQLMIKGIELCRHSNIPLFILGNPGAGKTTQLNFYAKAKGFGMKSIPATLYASDELQGMPFMVEGKENRDFHVVDEKGDIVEIKLSPSALEKISAMKGRGNRIERILPDWYLEVEKLAKENKEVILFIDELTTADEDMQAVYLTIIFDKKVAGVPLPENVTIVAAGNYASNLGGDFNMISPLLSRFMILNLQPNPLVDLEEFLLTSKVKYDFPAKEYTFSEATVEGTKSSIREFFFEFFSQLIKQGKVNFSNVSSNFTDAPEAGQLEDVKGLLTYRTIYYATELTYSALCLGMYRTEIFNRLFMGLIGSCGAPNSKTKPFNIYEEFLTFSIKHPFLGEAPANLTEQFTPEGFIIPITFDVAKVEITECIDFLEKAISFSDSGVIYTHEDLVEVDKVLSVVRGAATMGIGSGITQASFRALNNKLKVAKLLLTTTI